MPAPVQKVIIANKPTELAFGQYNLSDDGLTGAQQTNNASPFDLYSLFESDPLNQQLHITPSSQHIGAFPGLGKIVINSAKIRTEDLQAGDGLSGEGGVDESTFVLYFLDDALEPNLTDLISTDENNQVIYQGCGDNQYAYNSRNCDLCQSVYNAFRDIIGDPSNYFDHDPYKIMHKYKFNPTDGGGIYELMDTNTNNCGDHFNSSGDYCYPDPSEMSSNDQAKTLNAFPYHYTNINNTLVVDTDAFRYSMSNNFDYNGNFYILNWSRTYEHTQSQNGNGSERRHVIGVYVIPKKQIYDAWTNQETITLTWDVSGTYPIPDFICGSGSARPGSMPNTLSLTITPPSNYDDYIFETDYLPYSRNIDTWYLARPTDKPILTNTSNFLESNGFNFRPISTVTVVDEQYDLQSYYTDVLDKSITSSPNNVFLTFDIAQTGNEYNPRYLNVENNNNLKYRAFVVNWDWQENDPTTLDEILNTFPESNIELLNYQNDDLFIPSDIIIAVDNEDGSPNHIMEPLQHVYQTPGIKTIKAIVYSYVNVLTLNDFQPMEWKIVTIRLNLAVDSTFEQEFEELGGYDFSVIPWPETTPIIGGISDESQYISSLNSIIKQNLFETTEMVDKENVYSAYYNEELGDHLGPVDLSQARLFMGSYDMNQLLMIQDQVSPDGIDFNPYFNKEYWNGETNSLPMESCVGTIFINDNMTKMLRDECIIEYNFTDIDNNVVRDSSGNSNKGILLGDFKVDKDDKNQKVYRKKSIKLPTVKVDDDGAF